MSIDSDLLMLPCVKSDPSLLRLLDHCAGPSDTGVPDAGLSGTARLKLLRLMREDKGSAESLATELNMSVRTLHRTLSKEDLSFKKLVDQVRLSEATRHLQNRMMSVSEIAYLLGFSELSAFHRAFKRWTGLTPVEYRRKNLST